MARPEVVRGDALRDPAEQTPGMHRSIAFDTEGVWVGTARTAAGMVSGWHHHSGHTTYAYCVTGAIRIESGPSGGDVIEARPGDFFVVPAETVHRESNPTEEEALVVLVRVGRGTVVVEAERPDAE